MFVSKATSTMDPPRRGRPRRLMFWFTIFLRFEISLEINWRWLPTLSMGLNSPSEKCFSWTIVLFHNRTKLELYRICLDRRQHIQLNIWLMQQLKPLLAVL